MHNNGLTILNNFYIPCFYFIFLLLFFKSNYLLFNFYRLLFIDMIFTKLNEISNGITVAYYYNYLQEINGIERDYISNELICKQSS